MHANIGVGDLVKCDKCNHDTCELVEFECKNYCPKCHQEEQEIGAQPLTIYANVYDCYVCGERIKEYGVKVGDDIWVCIKCVDKGVKEWENENHNI